MQAPYSIVRGNASLSVLGYCLVVGLSIKLLCEVVILDGRQVCVSRCFP